ncbi:hypothetical protein [Salibaculum halophilum]|uniref:hypothetical protein n=1 Tax=Salibaculum halophilum TaxID=1914408 RepID=UPI000A121024|nr:hypothetical protein [Salibaculum halophilum]
MMKTAGVFLLISSALHVAGAVLSGFAPVGQFLLFPAVLYLALYAGLARGMLWVAWLGFICMLGGMAGTILELAAPGPVPAWVLWGILGADLAAAVALFAAIWAGPRAARA